MAGNISQKRGLGTRKPMIERRVRASGRQMYGRVQPLRPPRRRSARLPRMGMWQRRLILLVVLLSVGGFALWKMFAIETITVKSPGRGGEIQQEALKIVHGSLAQSNLLTLDGPALAASLQKADPLLRDVNVRRHWSHGVVISTTLKKPSLGWSTDNQKYLLDYDGTAIETLSLGSGLPVVTDGSNLPVHVGQKVVSNQFVSFVLAMVPALSKAGYVVTGMDVKETTLDLNVSTNKGYRLVLDTSREVGGEMADLAAVQKLLSSQHKAPHEYIDLRIEGKAYYK